MIDVLMARLSTPSIDADTVIRNSPTNPYYLVQARPLAPTGRRLTNDADTLPLVAWVMAVNNSPEGCLYLVQRAIALLDNWWPDQSGPAIVTFTGPVTESDGPGVWRWAQGIEVRTNTPKDAL